jgi:hypothetical protein
MKEFWSASTTFYSTEALKNAGSRFHDVIFRLLRDLNASSALKAPRAKFMPFSFAISTMAAFMH